MNCLNSYSSIDICNNCLSMLGQFSAYFSQGHCIYEYQHLDFENHYCYSKYRWQHTYIPMYSAHGAFSVTI